ncbi:MAG: undecaprenyldiphospho-muramoylpentapeptide beta-N-acetylglucosaminyltransferase [Bacilli bacterium]|nr:undecaprenyldiphospho-muramoylpentapeptide beta-N-acetylglucosaminyltransferase [Bacilli bacterium]
MKVIISAGGTGGHIYPALAIINKIKEKEPNSKFLYIGTTDRMEKDLIPSLGINYVGVEMKGLDRKNPLNNIKIISMYNKAKKKISEEIKKFNPDIVIGVGGYITVPVILSAHKLKYKTVIHEQNSIPGMSNKFLSKYVNKVLLSLPGSSEYFKKDKTVYTGNPRSEEIISIKEADKKELGLKENKKLVVIVMGSLGSATINEKEKEMVNDFKEKNYEVLLITGEKYYNDYSKMSIPENVKVYPFLKNFINVLKKADLIVTRAGASTIAEITAIGLPSILVPSPYVTNNHQYKNVKELEEKGCSKILEEKDFCSKNLIPMIDKLLEDEKEYEKMKNSAKKLGVENSATKVYNEIKKVVDAK